MSTIGRITVPTPTPYSGPVNSVTGAQWPLISDFGFGTRQDFPIVAHRFGDLATKSVQIYNTGIGPHIFTFRRSNLSLADRTTLLNFYEAVQGSFQSFSYAAPNADGSKTNYTVIFEAQPLSFDMLVHAARTGLTFVEIPTSNPSYTVSNTCLRFPSSALETALLGQTQTIIPLVHIRVRESAVADIYLSDRKITIGGQQYLPRLLNIGEPGSDVIMTQDISGKADNVQFTFGNGDRVMTALSNDTDLKNAEIDLSLFHVESSSSGTVLQLWKGFVQNFTSDGSPHFTMQCSDGLFQVMQQYPPAISRTCRWFFNDGVNCPYASAGSGGDPNSCDYTYNGPNGCTSHNMQVYFGGQQLAQQAAIAHSNNNRITATSIVTDSGYGTALPDIYCNQGATAVNAFFVNAIMMVVRDEAQFLDALGIIGAGPLFAYTVTPTNSGEFVTNADGYNYFVGPTVDGFPAQGWVGNSSGTGGSNKQPSGLRQIVGNFPAGSSETFGLTGVGGSEPGFTYSSGTAFVELRYQKAGGVVPSVPEQHTMSVPIAQGLSGWTWDASGTRTLTPGLTNPFWIAINTYLRSLGIFNADSATQLQTFVLSSLVNSTAWTDANGNSYSGTGCAQIADLIVPNILGSGSGTQFEFQGIIGGSTANGGTNASGQRPLRDWLVDIAACGLGYFTFQYGQLYLGCRINASATDTFTLGNMLFQSLRLSPIEARYEGMTLQFADKEYQYAGNTAQYVDKDHAAYYGRANAPLITRASSIGIPTINQALRVAVTQVREEVGGVNTSNTFNNGTNVVAAEWKNARIATWGTTILALNTTVGQVVSVTHPDIPGGVGDFRIKKWTLKKDWSIEITGQTVTVSMYQLDVGPKPADVAALPLPVLPYPVPDGPSWAPYQERSGGPPGRGGGEAADALWPLEWTFAAGQSYGTDASGNPTAAVSITGKLPVNSVIPNCGAPGIAAGNIARSTTGGSIPGGTILRVSVCGTQTDTDGNPQLTPPSQVILVVIPTGTDTNQFTLSDITWPTITTLTGYVLFASSVDDLICAQATGTLTYDGSAYSPTSTTFGGPIVRSTWGLPDNLLTGVRIKAREAVHLGVLGAAVDSVSPNTIVSAETIDITGRDNWAGRVLWSIGRYNGEAPNWTANIIHFDASTGTFTLDRDPTAAGVVISDLTFQANAIQGGFTPGDGLGDAFVVCFQGYDNSAAPTVLADSGLYNVDNPTPHSGLQVNAEKNFVIRVVAGKSRGMEAKVVSNFSNGYIVNPALPIDATSVWIVLAPGYDNTTPEMSIGTNGSYLQQATANFPVSNYQNLTVWFTGFTEDSNGIESSVTDAPGRPVYIYGAGLASVTITDDYQMLPSDVVIRADTTAKPITVTLVDTRALRRSDRTFVNVGTGGNLLTINAVSGQTLGIGGPASLTVPDQGGIVKLYADVN